MKSLTKLSKQLFSFPLYYIHCLPFTIFWHTLLTYLLEFKSNLNNKSVDVDNKIRIHFTKKVDTTFLITVLLSKWTTLLQFPLICLQTHILENVELSRNLTLQSAKSGVSLWHLARESTQSNSFLANTLENLIPGFLKILLKLFLLAYNQSFYLFFFLIGNDWKNKVKKSANTCCKKLCSHKYGVRIRCREREWFQINKRTKAFLFSKGK